MAPESRHKQHELFALYFGNSIITVQDTLDINKHYDVSYEKGSFWENANVDSHENCGGAADPINPDWFYRESPLQLDGVDANNNDNNDHRSSDAVAQQMFSELVEEHPDADSTEIVKMWSIRVCLYEQNQSDSLCLPPSNGYNDCSSMELDADTLDIDVTLEELLEDEALTECMVDTRLSLYEWAKAYHQLKYLCAGCFDPFCDRSFLDDGQCLFDANAHHEHILDDMDTITNMTIMTIMDMGTNNMLIIAAIIALCVLWTAKEWISNQQQTTKSPSSNNKPRDRASLYGSI